MPNSEKTYYAPPRLKFLMSAMMQREGDPPKDGNAFLSYTNGQGYSIVRWNKQSEEFVANDTKHMHRLTIDYWIKLV